MALFLEGRGRWRGKAEPKENGECERKYNYKCSNRDFVLRVKHDRIRGIEISICKGMRLYFVAPCKCIYMYMAAYFTWQNGIILMRNGE